MSNEHPVKRRDLRYPTRLELTLKVGDKRITAVAADVSYRGLFACTDTPPALRQLFTIEAKAPPHDGVFESHAMSVFVREPGSDDTAPSGVGVQFYAQSAPAQELWSAYIAHLKNNPEAGPPKPYTPAPNRRHHERFLVRLAVKPRTPADLETFFTRDVSKGGMFLATRKQVDLDTELVLDVYHPKSDALFSLRGVVKHHAKSPPGIGIEFVGLTDVRREEFLQFVRKGIPVIEVSPEWHNDNE